MNDEYDILLNYYRGKKASKIKNDIKHEKNMFRKKILEQVYIELNRLKLFKEK